MSSRTLRIPRIAGAPQCAAAGQSAGVGPVAEPCCAPSARQFRQGAREAPTGRAPRLASARSHARCGRASNPRGRCPPVFPVLAAQTGLTAE